MDIWNEEFANEALSPIPVHIFTNADKEETESDHESEFEQEKLGERKRKREWFENTKESEEKQAKRSKKRDWQAWSVREELCFYDSLKCNGRDFHKIAERMQDKNYEQVRHFFYREVKKLNDKVLKPFGHKIVDVKKPGEATHALLAWRKLVKNFK